MSATLTGMVPPIVMLCGCTAVSVRFAPATLTTAWHCVEVGLSQMVTLAMVKSLELLPIA